MRLLKEFKIKRYSKFQEMPSHLLTFVGMGSFLISSYYAWVLIKVVPNLIEALNYIPLTKF